MIIRPYSDASPPAAQHREVNRDQLRDKATDNLIGSVDDKDFDFLVDQLEEESLEDQDYYIDAATIDMLEQDSAPATLTALLRRALGSAEGLDVRWVRA